MRKRGRKAHAQARDRMAKQDQVMALVDEWLAPIDESTPPGQMPAQRVGKVPASLPDQAESLFTRSPAERGVRLTEKGVLSMTGEEYLNYWSGPSRKSSVVPTRRDKPRAIESPARTKIAKPIARNVPMGSFT